MSCQLRLRKRNVERANERGMTTGERMNEQARGRDRERESFFARQSYLVVTKRAETNLFLFLAATLSFIS